MEEVTKLSKSMVNDLTKVKQGQTAHSFVGPAPQKETYQKSTSISEAS